MELHIWHFLTHTSTILRMITTYLLVIGKKLLICLVNLKCLIYIDTSVTYRNCCLVIYYQDYKVEFNFEQVCIELFMSIPSPLHLWRSHLNDWGNNISCTALWGQISISMNHFEWVFLKRKLKGYAWIR